MIIPLKIAGVLLIGLALVHAIFPKYFRWKEELAGLSMVNRQIFKVHTFFIALTVFLMGLLCLGSADALTQTSLGKQVCLGLAVFWSIRLVLQFFGYSTALWRGKPFETFVHILFSLFWIYLTVVFWLAYWGS